MRQITISSNEKIFFIKNVPFFKKVTQQEIERSAAWPHDKANHDLLLAQEIFLKLKTGCILPIKARTNRGIFSDAS